MLPTLAAIAGVNKVTALQHRHAYVGNDLKDIYGVDPDTIVASTKLRDSYFVGGTANQLMARLLAKPDAALISAETAKDFHLTIGDTISPSNSKTGGQSNSPMSRSLTWVSSNSFGRRHRTVLLWRTRVTFAQTGTDTVVSFLIDTDHGDTAAGAARVQSAVGGVLFGTISGWALTRMIVKVLTGVFDPNQPTL